jgi:hypothetical protein
MKKGTSTQGSPMTTTKPRIKVVTSNERERPTELVTEDSPTDDPTQERVSDSATIFGKWIREWRQEKRKGGKKEAAASQPSK